MCRYQAQQPNPQEVLLHRQPVEKQEGNRSSQHQKFGMQVKMQKQIPLQKLPDSCIIFSDVFCKGINLKDYETSKSTLSLVNAIAFFLIRTIYKCYTVGRSGIKKKE